MLNNHLALTIVADVLLCSGQVSGDTDVVLMPCVEQYGFLNGSNL